MSLLPHPLRQPIGVFDSGVGGLTVLKALREQMPDRDFIYLADTARVPYGRKPKAMVEEFAAGITAFLLELDVVGVVIACNTASAAALPQLAASSSVPIWGVIDPGVEAACRVSESGHVGVIGTSSTIRSGAYQTRLEAKGLQVWAQACPLFVHLVEEGLASSEEAALLAQHYLRYRPDIDTLILGCTHYPILRSIIQQTVGDSVRLVESASVTADVVRAAHASLSNNHTGRIHHFVTGDVLAYRHTAEVIGGVDGEISALDVTTLSRALA
jgi:glutamate racemase